jgi:hypothetical protein
LILPGPPPRGDQIGLALRQSFGSKGAARLVLVE